METKDKRIKLIRDQVEKAKSGGPGRPRFPKGMKENVVMLLESGVAAVDIARMTGLSISSLSRWGSKPGAFHKVTKEKRLKTAAVNDFSFKLTLLNGIVLESSSETVFKKLFDLVRS